MGSVRYAGRMAGILLATMALAFALLPGTALAAGPADAAVASTDTGLVDGGGSLASVAPVELGRQHSEWKIVCERTRDGSSRTCTRWAPGRCNARRTHDPFIRRCVGSGARQHTLL